MTCYGPYHDATRNRWRVRWGDEAGTRTRDFSSKNDADAFLRELRGEQTVPASLATMAAEPPAGEPARGWWHAVLTGMGAAVLAGTRDGSIAVEKGARLIAALAASARGYADMVDVEARVEAIERADREKQFARRAGIRTSDQIDMTAPRAPGGGNRRQE